jgi:hypothetical protein
MQATIKIKASELDYSFFKKLKSLFKNETIEISVDTNIKNTQKETKEEYLQRIDRALERIQKNENTFEFSEESFNELVEKYSSNQNKSDFIYQSS